MGGGESGRWGKLGYEGEERVGGEVESKGKRGGGVGGSGGRGVGGVEIRGEGGGQRRGEGIWGK